MTVRFGATGCRIGLVEQDSVRQLAAAADLPGGLAALGLGIG